MSEILVLVEQAGGVVRKSTLELLAVAAQIGDPVAVALGPGSSDAVSVLGTHGATTVCVSDSEAFSTPAAIAEGLAAVMGERKPAAVLVSSSTDAREIAGRVAVITDSGVVTDAVGVQSDLTVAKNAFGGAYNVTAKVNKGTPIITMRPNIVEPNPTGTAAAVVQVAAATSPLAGAVKVNGRAAEEKSARPDLTGAAVVVSGGRGLGSGEQFDALLNPLADVLGAAIGASRAATDAGWCDHRLQVGQTGSTVAPQLYIACGISGAIQHRAGMQTAKTVVVINKDPDAPIFDLADFGVVGDVTTILPALTDAIRARKG